MEKHVIVILALVLLGCSGPKYLSKPKDFQYNVNGLHLNCNLRDGKGILGEIIEVNSEEIVLLSVQKEQQVYKVPKEKLVSAKMIVSSTSDNPQGISLWAGMINLLSISHGYGATFSLPINLIFTLSIANDAAYGTYTIPYPDNITWDQMRKFARFPQGIPQSIPLDSIR